MTDSHTNIHIAPGAEGANVNSSALLSAGSPALFKSPVTFLQMGVWMFLAGVSLASIGLGGFFSLPPHEASVPAAQVLIPQPVPPLKTPGIKTDVSVPGVNLSGVTVMARSDTGSPVSLAARADAPDDFAISLGEARAFSTLARRFENIALMNTALFQKLEARAIFVETSSGLAARLLAGPFENEKEAAIICGILLLPDGIICKTQAFEGDLISRQ